MVRCNQSWLLQSKILFAEIALNRVRKSDIKCRQNPHKPYFKNQPRLPKFWVIFLFSATRLTVKSNGLEEEYSEEASTACKAVNEAKPKQQKKKSLEETKTEEIPLKKKKKKRKPGQTVDSPGNTWCKLNIN